jgi:hypothetical protein
MEAEAVVTVTTGESRAGTEWRGNSPGTCALGSRSTLANVWRLLLDRDGQNT